MPELFPIDQALLAKSQAILGERRKLYWILGGSCTGKSTLAKLLGNEVGIEALDMDELIYDRFIPGYTAERHPASKSWFGADNPLNWVLSLSWPEFNALNRATNAEFLDLLSDQLAPTPVGQALLIDGGFTHPSVLAQVVSPANIVCLETSDEIRFQMWETGEERAAMKGWIHDLPEGQDKWQKFLFFDKMIAETLVNESSAAGIPVLTRHQDTSTETLTGLIKTNLGLETRD